MIMMIMYSNDIINDEIVMILENISTNMDDLSWSQEFKYFF